MNKKALIDIYRAKLNHPNLGKSHGNGIIIGIEIDENNKINYVVSRGGTITLEDFRTAMPKLQKVIKHEKVTINDGTAR